MRPILASTAVLAVTALASCGGGGGASAAKDDSEKVVKDWVTAATERDGAKYCKQLSKDLLEQITSAQSDSAKTKCENLVKKDDPKLPLRVTIKPGKASETAATSTITVQAPKGPVTLRKEDGSFKIDKAAVSQPTEPKPKPIPKPKPKKKRKK
ncbi:MAG: hypothetical protein H0U20_04335 [Thermoleophilaceae bacterium]|nr:hypothetical protein [Thermoleophilaceae bacterium]